MERLILARHGETDWNAKQLVNGDPAVLVALSARGRDEARRLGAELADERIDLCATSPFPRTKETAELALAARAAASAAAEREVPRLVLVELGDPGYGSYEGGPLADYRAWAAGAPSSTPAPGGGEARSAIVRRYALAFRRLLALAEESVLCVCHSLPVAYALAGREGDPPGPRAALVANAHPYPFTRAQLERAVETMESWCASPTW